MHPICPHCHGEDTEVVDPTLDAPYVVLCACRSCGQDFHACLSFADMVDLSFDPPEP